MTIAKLIELLKPHAEFNAPAEVEQWVYEKQEMVRSSVRGVRITTGEDGPIDLVIVLEPEV